MVPVEGAWWNTQVGTPSWDEILESLDSAEVVHGREGTTSQGEKILRSYQEHTKYFLSKAYPGHDSSMAGVIADDLDMDKDSVIDALWNPYSFSMWSVVELWAAYGEQVFIAFEEESKS